MSSGFCFETDMTHFVLLQHMVLQNIHRNNKHKSIQRSKKKKIHRLYTEKLNTCIHTIQCHANTVRFGKLII